MSTNNPRAPPKGGRKTSKSRRQKRRRQQKRRKARGGNHLREEEYSDDAAMQRQTTKELRSALAFDPRSSHGIDPDIFISNVNPAVPFVVPTNAEVMLAPVLAATTYALSRGWLLNATTDSDPYLATVYMWRFLVDATNNQDPELSTVPRWLHFLYQAVIQKRIKSKGGVLMYNFDMQSQPNNDYEIPVGPAQSGAAWVNGVKGGTFTNSIFSNMVAPVAYTNDEGARAAQQMWNFLATIHPGHPMHVKVSTISPNAMTDDASAYAVINVGPGGGFGNVGGWKQREELEVPVHSPLFGCFKAPLDPAQPEDNARAPVFIRNFSGDGSLLGGCLVADLMPSQIHFKQPVQYHFVDFLEFLNTMALFVCKVQEQHINNVDFANNVATNPNYFAEFVQCPISLQEMGLLLRAVMMEAFAYTQFKGQTVYPRSVENQENEFVSFTAGTNTCPYVGTTQMRLPRIIKHNILSLTGRTNYAGRGGKKNPHMYIPVLGQFRDDKLDQKTYKNVIEETEYYCFYTPNSEADISFVDGSSGSNYVFINDPAPLQKLVERWNGWLINNYDYMWPTEPVGTDHGVDPLWSGAMTMHWRFSSNRPQMEKRKSRKKIDERFAPAALTQTIYTTREDIAISSGPVPLKAAWESIQQYFIFAQNLIGPPDNAVTSFTGYTRMASFLNETNQLSLGIGSSNFVIKQDRHETLAQMGVKTKFALKDPISEFFGTADEKGQGGILSSLLSTFAGVFVPGAGPIVKKIIEA